MKLLIASHDVAASKLTQLHARQHFGAIVRLGWQSSLGCCASVLCPNDVSTIVLESFEPLATGIVQIGDLNVAVLDGVRCEFQEKTDKDCATHDDEKKDEKIHIHQQEIKNVHEQASTMDQMIEQNGINVPNGSLKSANLTTYTRKQVDDLKRKLELVDVDILISYEWPEGWNSVGSSRMQACVQNESTIVGELARACTARYHFASGNNQRSVQLPPYRNRKHVTRFIAIATTDCVGEKSVYAANIAPLSTINVEEVPSDTIACPYTALKIESEQPIQLNAGLGSSTVIEPTNKRQRIDAHSDQITESEIAFPSRWLLPAGTPEGQQAPPPSYLCHTCNQPGHWRRNCPVNVEQQAMRKLSRSMPPDTYICNKCKQPGHFIRDCPQQTSQERHQNLTAAQQGVCWFCLGSEKVAQHLIVSVGDHSYVAMPKGALTAEHVLIMPIVHVENAVNATAEQNQEMRRYIEALRLYYDSRGQVPFIYERNIPTRIGQHYHLQCINLTPSLSLHAEKLLFQHSIERQIPFRELAAHESLKQLATLENDCGTNSRKYLYVEANGKRFIHLLQERSSSSAFNFVREVVAQVLGRPERADWKNCEINDSEEAALTEELKSRFQPFDFALNSVAAVDKLE